VTSSFEYAVLFDMDGVLIDSFEVWHQVLNATAEALGHPPIFREAIVQSWGQGIEADVEKYYRANTVDEVEALFHRLFPDHIDRLTVNDGAHTTVEGLRERGVGCAVITNTPKALAADMLQLVELEPDVLVSGTDVPRSKPAPDMVYLACEKLGVPPARACVVGDSEYDRRAAESARVRFLGHGDIEADRSLPTLCDLLAILDAEMPEREIGS